MRPRSPVPRFAPPPPNSSGSACMIARFGRPARAFRRNLASHDRAGQPARPLGHRQERRPHRPADPAFRRQRWRCPEVVVFITNPRNLSRSSDRGPPACAPTDRTWSAPYLPSRAGRSARPRSECRTGRSPLLDDLFAQLQPPRSAFLRGFFFSSSSFGPARSQTCPAPRAASTAQYRFRPVIPRGHTEFDQRLPLVICGHPTFRATSTIRGSQAERRSVTDLDQPQRLVHQPSARSGQRQLPCFTFQAPPPPRRPRPCCATCVGVSVGGAECGVRIGHPSNPGQVSPAAQSLVLERSRRPGSIESAAGRSRRERLCRRQSRPSLFC